MNALGHKGGWNDQAFLLDQGLYLLPWEMYSISNSKHFHLDSPLISELKDKGTLGLVPPLTTGG